MAEILFEADALTGVKYHWDYDEQNGIAHVHQSQDVSPFLDYAAEMRALGISHDRIKEDNYLIHHAVIPPVVQQALRARGLQVGMPEHADAIAKIIETDYPYLLCSNHKMFR